MTGSTIEEDPCRAIRNALERISRIVADNPPDACDQVMAEREIVEEALRVIEEGAERVACKVEEIRSSALVLKELVQVRTGSLWEGRDPNAPSPLAGLVVRDPTPEEIEKLRKKLEEFEAFEVLGDHGELWKIIRRDLKPENE